MTSPIPAQIPIRIIDAFTAVPFRGNPAAVVVLDPDLAATDEWMQSVATEANLSETAFLTRIDASDRAWSLRWFTPTVEIELCGHATLASVHALVEIGLLARGVPARFVTRTAGDLVGTHLGTAIELDFPAKVAEPTEMPAGLAQALGVEPIAVVRTDDGYVVAEFADEAQVHTIDPDLARLAAIGDCLWIVTARASAPEHDFVSRVFAPAHGIPEDPVTGSAHCVLGPYWAGKIAPAERKHDRDGSNAGATFVGYQASKRGGTVEVQLRGDRALLRGQAVTVMSGELLAPPEGL